MPGVRTLRNMVPARRSYIYSFMQWPSARVLNFGCGGDRVAANGGAARGDLGRPLTALPRLLRLPLPKRPALRIPAL